MDVKGRREKLDVGVRDDWDKVMNVAEWRGREADCDTGSASTGFVLIPFYETPFDIV